MKLIKPLIIAFVVLSLVACGDKENQASGSDDEEITLKFLHPGSPEVMNPIFDPLIEEFMEENPNIKIERMNLGYEDTGSKYPTMASAGNLPDVMYMTIDRGFELASSDSLVPLNDFLSDSNLKEEISDSLFDGIKYDDNNYWVPAGVGSMQIWYNTDLFEEAGLDPSKPPETLDDLATVAQKITEETGVPGLGLPGQIKQENLSALFQSIYSSMSGDPIWDTDKEQLTISQGDNKKHAIEALQYLYDLVNKHEVTQPNIIEFDRNDLRTMMRDGKVAMVIDGIWIKSIIQDEVENEEILPAIFPAGEGGSHGVVGVDGWSIAKNSEHPEEAWKLIEFLMETENQARHANMYGLNPVLDSEYELDEFKTEFWEPIIEGGETGYSRIAHENVSALETNVISEGVQAAMIGKITPEEAFDLIQENSKEYLEE